MATRRIANPVLLVCDIQEKFRSAIYGFDKVVFTASKMLRAAHILDMPVLVTTQNRARLGNTVPELAALMGTGTAVGARVLHDEDKTRFSMWTPSLRPVWEGLGGSGSSPTTPPSAVIVGIEAHICVTQTALDLLAAGYPVAVLADGVSSSRPQEAAVALARLRAAGATVTTSESWLYECLGDAQQPAFRRIIGLVKDTSQDTQAALATLASKI